MKKLALICLMLAGCTGGYVNTTQIAEAGKIFTDHKGLKLIGSDQAGGTGVAGRFVFICNDGKDFAGPTMSEPN